MTRLFAFSVLSVVSISAPAFAEKMPLEGGGVKSNLACQASPGIHYNLYAPPNLETGQQIPILYVFSPSGNARVDLFEKPASQLGWAVCGSVENRNGLPSREVIAIFTALKTEMKSKFTVHPHRNYYTGVSGGARVAYELCWMHPDESAGVIGMAAGMARREVPNHPGVACVGIAGQGDFNFWEVFELRYRFADVKMPFRFLEWQGGHDWGPEELVADAMEWLEFQYYLKSPHLNEKERAARPRVLNSYLSYVSAVQPRMEAYELLEALAADCGKEPETLKKMAGGIEETLKSLRQSLNKELAAREEIEKHIRAEIAKGGVVSQGRDLAVPSTELAQKHLGTLYGTRASTFASSIEKWDKMRREAPQ